jgi:formyltetrahydrofolate-dependent phosphoribosylglycinamide formyltransferase
VDKPVRTAVLASGYGSLLESLLAHGVAVDLVVADRECRALAVAAEGSVRACLIERTSFGPTFDRGAYTARVVDLLQSSGVDLVVMAGFMTVLAPRMFEAFAGRVINSHPSLLPAFPGAHAVADALGAGVTETGCTIHIATAVVDEGPTLAQEIVAVHPRDSVETVHERIKRVERVLLPRVVKQFQARLAEEMNR